MHKKNYFHVSVLFFCFSAFGLPETKVIAHVADYNGLFSSQVILENLTTEKVEYTLTPYTRTGSPLTPVEGEMAANSSMTYTVDDLFNEPAEVSHFKIEGNVFATISYVIKEGPGSPAHVGMTEETASRFKFFPGNWEEIFDGIAVVNMGNEAADVWVTQKNTQGNMIQSVKAIEMLAPMAKGLYVIGAPTGSSFTASAGSYYEVYSNQVMAITALRGTAPGAPVGFLWANGTTARSQASSTRDNQGVWFITDGSLFDVMEMMGYDVANDRLWQLELYRRSGRGTLAEIFGASYTDQDVQVRTTGYSDEELDAGYEALTSQAKTVISAYIHGVNRHIAEANSNSGLMPFECSALGLSQVAPWDHRDILAWGALLQRNFDPMDYGVGQSENAALLQEILADNPISGINMFNDIKFLNDPDAPTMIPGTPSKNRVYQPQAPIQLRDDIDFGNLAARLRSRQDHNDALLERINAKVKMGSYAWVVSGDKTESGNPILYSGPQMGFSTPSIVCEGSIRGGGLNISGMTVPGIPGIIIGRTPHHAWSMQVGHAHTSDLYLETPASISGGPHRMETIKVAGEADVEIPVYRTSHGPVVALEPAIAAWKYAHWGYEFDMVDAMIQLATAQSMDEFGEAIEMIAVSQHFCYADRDGNIAYWMSGRDPVRAPGEYRLPQGAVAQPLEYDIANVIPKSHDRNTAQGFYGGWNNKSNPDYPNSPFGSSHQYGPFHRAHAVQDYLRTHDNLTYEDVRDLAINIAATRSFGSGGNPWAFVKDEFTTIIEANSSDTRSAALQLLNNWDGHAVAGGEVHWINGQDLSDGWVLMDEFVRKVLDYTFEEVPEVGTLNRFMVLLHSFDSSSLSTNFDWFSNTQNTEAPQTLEAIVLKALDDTLAELGARPWGIGERGTIDYVHPMLGLVHQTPEGSRSTYAHCVEFDENGPNRIESMFPLGESGFIKTGVGEVPPEFDPYFFSLAPFFDGFTPRNFPLFE